MPKNSRWAALALALVTWVMLSVPAEATLVGLYEFNDPTNLGLDSSGLANNLNVFGSGVAYTGSGYSGGGLSLSGAGGLTTSTGTVPGGFPLGNSDYTLSAWIKTPTSGALGIIGWGSYGSVNTVNAFRLIAGGGLDNYWWANDIGAAANTSNNAWHNVVATFDGTTRSLYFDGTLIASDSPTGHNVQNANFAIGRTCVTCSGGGSEFFVGTLDSVAVRNNALTAMQVQGLAAASAVPEPSALGPLCLGLVTLTLSRRRTRLKSA